MFFTCLGNLCQGYPMTEQQNGTPWRAACRPADGRVLRCLELDFVDPGQVSRLFGLPQIVVVLHR